MNMTGSDIRRLVLRIRWTTRTSNGVGRWVRPSSALTTLLAVSLAASALIPPERARADVLAGTNESVLVRQPQVGAQAQGDGAVIGLQYADPAEQLVVMDPPQPSNQGDAQLQHP